MSTSSRSQLAYAATTRTSAFLVQTPVPEEPEMMGIFLDQNKHPDRTPAGHSLISVYTDSPAATAWMGRPDEELIAWGREKTETILPELRGHLMFSELSRWPKMAHANRPGFYRDAATARARLRPGPVVAAGDWFSKTSQETAVAGGERAAQALLTSWRHSSSRSHLATA